MATALSNALISPPRPVMTVPSLGGLPLIGNLLDFRKTPIHRVFETVRSEAERYGVPIVGSEIVGLVPQDALLSAVEHYLRIEGFSSDLVFENRMQSAE